MTAKVWDVAFNQLMLNEGGYVCDPNDKGGETKWGISKAQYPDLDICNLTQEQAKEIYFKDYWLKNKCDRFPDPISICLFDFCVNSNAKKAIKLLQECLRVPADGIIGNQTIGAGNRLPLNPIIEEYCEKRLDYLMSLGAWKFYCNGWSRRVKEVKELALRYV